MPIIKRPACIQGEDHGQYKYVCSTFGLTHEEYTRRGRWLRNEWFPAHRSEIFNENEQVSFKDEANRAKLFALLKSDTTISSWLDAHTARAISLMSNGDETRDVFWYVIYRMAVFKIGRSQSAPGRVAAPPRADIAAKQETPMSTDTHEITNNEISSSAPIQPTSIEQNSIETSPHGTPFCDTERHSSTTTTERTVPEFPSYLQDVSTSSLDIPDYNWRHKIILVHFPDGAASPFIVRAQPALRTKNPITCTDITHQIFMDRVKRFKDYDVRRSSLRIVFANEWDLTDEAEFFEALFMHEYDEEFNTKAIMNVVVQDA